MPLVVDSMTADQRSDFLADLLRRYYAQIQKTVALRLKPHQAADFLRGDAQQIFLIGANAALGRAIKPESDEHSTVIAYCGRRGIGAIHDHIFQNYYGRGRGTRPPAARMESESLDGMCEAWNDRTTGGPNIGFFPAVDRWSVPVETCVVSTMEVDAFLARLSPTERTVITLMLEGETDGIRLTCSCDRSHSAMADVAAVTSKSVSRIEKILSAVRAAARESFYVAT